MVGLKTTLPIGIGVALAGLFLAAAIIGISGGGTTVTHTTTVFSISETTIIGTINVGSTVTTTATGGIPATVTLTQTQTVSTTVVQGQRQPANVTLVVSCSGCQIGFGFQYQYTGTATNGTQGHQQSTSINGSGSTVYHFAGNPSLIAAGSWSVSWSVYATGNVGTLEVKAYFNSALVSDKSTPTSSGLLLGTVEVSVS